MEQGCVEVERRHDANSGGARPGRNQAFQHSGQADRAGQGRAGLSSSSASHQSIHPSSLLSLLRWKMGDHWCRLHSR